MSGSESESGVWVFLHSRISWGKWNYRIILVQSKYCPLVLLGYEVWDSLRVLGSEDGKGLSLFSVVEILHGSGMSWFLVNLPPLPSAPKNYLNE